MNDEDGKMKSRHSFRKKCKTISSLWNFKNENLHGMLLAPQLFWQNVKTQLFVQTNYYERQQEPVIEISVRLIWGQNW